MRHLDVAVGVVFRDSKVLIARRKPGGALGGYWEFPGGKTEPGESLEDCLRRELLEELAIRVQPVMSFTPIMHQYAEAHVTLHAFLCTHEAGNPQPLACEEIRWVTPASLRNYAFPEANRKLIDELIASLPGEPDPAVPPRVHKPKRPLAHHPAPV